jgi:hypothetical protein
MCYVTFSHHAKERLQQREGIQVPIKVAVDIEQNNAFKLAYSGVHSQTKQYIDYWISHCKKLILVVDADKSLVMTILKEGPVFDSLKRKVA